MTTIVYGISIVRSFQTLGRSFEKVFSIVLGLSGVVIVTHDLLHFFKIIESVFLLEIFTVVISLFYANIAQKKSISETKKLVAQKKEIELSLEKLKEAEKELEKSSQLAIVGQLSSEVAKAFDDPLKFIEKESSALREDKISELKQSQLIQRLQKNIQKLNLFVQELLVYTKPYQPQFEEISLRKCVNTSYESALAVRTQITNCNDVEVEFKVFDKGQDQIVVADAQRLELGFRHVFLNAIENMDSRGSIKVTIQKHEKHPVDIVEVQIADNGVGLRMTTEDALKPFSTTNKDKPGLGLSIVQRITDEHHGVLKIENQKHSGVTVSICLPAIQSPSLFE